MNKIIFVLIFLLFFMIGCSTNENSSECIFPGGQGTAADPYQISSAEDLELLAAKIEKDEKGFISAYYILTQDI
ncbi:MAG: hypothetical protein PHR60_08150, partial [Eubacteriales bacterium]|nr:hypothetical protein [Eubacteriales bacterium]